VEHDFDVFNEVFYRRKPDKIDCVIYTSKSTSYINQIRNKSDFHVQKVRLKSPVNKESSVGVTSMLYWNTFQLAKSLKLPKMRDYLIKGSCM
jgi:hypothetical protein